jgi:hypothetical protein
LGVRRAVVMWLTGIQGLEVVVALVAGLLATVGALVVFMVAVGLVHRGVAIVGRFVVSRFRAREAEGRVIRGQGMSEPHPSFAPVPDPGLYARQAWWRLRC